MVSSKCKKKKKKKNPDHSAGEAEIQKQARRLYKSENINEGKNESHHSSVNASSPVSRQSLDRSVNRRTPATRWAQWASEGVRNV